MRKGLIFGLVALFTIFAFTMVGCGGSSTPSGGNPVEGTLSINSDAGEVIVGTVLTATHTDAPAGVTYKWQKDGSDVNGKTTLSFGVASEVGTYTIVASLEDYDDITASISVRALGPSDLIDTEIETAAQAALEDYVDQNDDAIIERLYLENSQLALFQFTIPTGKTLDDYSDITFDVMVDTANFAKSIRTRIVGWYTDPTAEFTEDALHAWVAKFDSAGGNGKDADPPNRFHPYILGNTKNSDGTNDGSWGDRLGMSAANTFTKVTYPLASNNGGTSVLGKSDSTKPDGSTGPLAIPESGKVWVGLGFPNYENSYDKEDGVVRGVAQWIANVTLVGKVEADSVVSPGSGFPADATSGKYAQYFASYAYNIQYNWRGAWNHKVMVPIDPAYVPPVQLPIPAVGTKVLDFGATSTATALNAILAVDNKIALKQAGTPSITVASGVITVTGRTQGYFGVDIAVSEFMDIPRDQYKIEVEGTVDLADKTTSAKMKLAGTNPYDTMKDSTGADAQKTVTGTAGQAAVAWSITVDYAPADWGTDIRIHSENIDNPAYSKAKVDAAAAVAAAWAEDQAGDDPTAEGDYDDWLTAWLDEAANAAVKAAYDATYDLTIPEKTGELQNYKINKIVITYLGPQDDDE